jgi:hypothetical protein
MVKEESMEDLINGIIKNCEKLNWYVAFNEHTQGTVLIIGNSEKVLEVLEQMHDGETYDIHTFTKATEPDKGRLH